MLHIRKGKIMKLSKTLAVVLALMFMLTACRTTQTELNQNQTPLKDEETVTDIIEIEFSDNEIMVDGVPVVSNAENNVYVENDIIYYESGKDFTYGEGSEEDAHSAEDAAEHTVVHITQPGTYSISGSLNYFSLISIKE